MASEPRPVLAAVLTAVGGALITLGGLVVWLFGAAVEHVFHFSSPLFVVGVFDGLLALASAGAMLVLPRGRRVCGVLAIVCAVLSIPFALGGLLIGFALTAAGGALAFVLPRFPMPLGTSPRWGRPPPWS